MNSSILLLFISALAQAILCSSQGTPTQEFEPTAPIRTIFSSSKECYVEGYAECMANLSRCYTQQLNLNLSLCDAFHEKCEELYSRCKDVEIPIYSIPYEITTIDRCMVEYDDCIVLRDHCLKSRWDYNSSTGVAANCSDIT